MINRTFASLSSNTHNHLQLLYSVFGLQLVICLLIFLIYFLFTFDLTCLFPYLSFSLRIGLLHFQEAIKPVLKFSVFLLPSVLCRCWLGGRKGIRPV